MIRLGIEKAPTAAKQRGLFLMSVNARAILAAVSLCPKATQMLETHISNVKKLLAQYESAARSTALGVPGANPTLHKNNLDWGRALNKLLEYLVNQDRLQTPIPKELGDLSDLPEVLLKELSVKRTDELESQILAVMRACSGEVNLDQVLVGLFRKFKVTQTRRFIQNKLYRMSQKEMVFAVPGQRASYQLEKPPESNPFERKEMDDEIPF